jgi:integral membrane protein (TIGR01906 family)
VEAPTRGVRAAPSTSRLAAGLIAASTALVILGASIAPFLTPAFVRFEQDRVGVGQVTGFGAGELDAVTGALLGDLVLWRGDFDVAVDGAPVLDDRERAHMRDVRGVFGGLWLLVGAAAVVLIVGFRRTRGTEARFATWRAVAGGARALAIAIAVAGVFAILAFEALFEVFHRLFFSTGSYTFDPRTDRLVQLFPQQFWSDTAIALGVVVLGAAILTAWQAGRKAAGWRTRPVFATSRART